MLKSGLPSQTSAGDRDNTDSFGISGDGTGGICSAGVDQIPVERRSCHTAYPQFSYRSPTAIALEARLRFPRGTESSGNDRSAGLFISRNYHNSHKTVLAYR